MGDAMTRVSILRTMLERASRGRSFRRTLTVGDQRAKIYVSGDAQLKYLKPGGRSFDRDLIEISLACLEPQDVVWDIGANIGVFSVAAALRANSVVAFEADIWLTELIRRTARLESNTDLDIQVAPIAVADRDGIMTFQIASRGRASNALTSAGGRSQMGGVREEIIVPAFCVDTIGRDLEPPDFVKIDVEGAEYMVVTGGEALFRDKSPLVYAEVGKEVYPDMRQFFLRLGYSVFDASANPLVEGKIPSTNCFFAKDFHTPRLDRLRERNKSGTKS